MKYQSTFLVPGVLSPSVLFENLNPSDLVKICGVLVKARRVESWRKFYHDFKTLLSFNDLEEEFSYALTSVDIDKYEKVLHMLLRDSRTFFLVERSFGVKGQKSTFNHLIRIETICINCLKILVKYNPSKVVFDTTPHDPRSWILGRAAEFMGIPVYFIRRTALPWRSWAVQGIDQHHVVSIDSLHKNIEQQKTELTGKSKCYLASNKADYYEAMPLLEKENLKKRRGNIWSWKEEFRNICWWSPAKAFKGCYELREKYRLYKAYCESSLKKIPNKKYIAFFLHFQPERSSLPEGLGYTQQWLAIRALSLAVPSDWVILVREHNSTFQRKYESIIRSPLLYEQCASLPNVCIAPLGVSTFEIVDHSVAVATLTGTVGFQAVCRNKCALVFGVARYRGCDGVYFVDGWASIVSAISDILKRSPLLNDSNLKRYCEKVEQLSISNNDDPGVFNVPLKDEQEGEMKLIANIIKSDACETIYIGDLCVNGIEGTLG
jgi:hypothetical protein